MAWAARSSGTYGATSASSRRWIREDNNSCWFSRTGRVCRSCWRKNAPTGRGSSPQPRHHLSSSRAVRHVDFEPSRSARACACAVLRIIGRWPNPAWIVFIYGERRFDLQCWFGGSGQPAIPNRCSPFSARKSADDIKPARAGRVSTLPDERERDTRTHNYRAGRDSSMELQVLQILMASSRHRVRSSRSTDELSGSSENVSNGPPPSHSQLGPTFGRDRAPKTVVYSRPRAAISR